MFNISHTIPELNAKGLRDFGLLTGGIVAGLFGLLIPWLLAHTFPVWPWVIGGLLAVWALLAPRTLNPIYRLWMHFGQFMSSIVTPVILGVVFFFLIAPAGLVMRLFRQDPMARRFDDSIESYRNPSQKPSRKNKEKPF